MSLPLMITDLLKPEAYSGKIGPEEIRLEQTHISFVIIAGESVYKIKKPVNFGFLDFTTLDKRRFYCQRELDLNRRLSPEVYLGVEEVRKKRGHFLYDGEGEVVDYAVKMKHLPEKGKMINRLKVGEVDNHAIKRIAEQIARFHAKAKTDGIITAGGGLETVIKNVSENFEQAKKYVGLTLLAKSLNLIKNYSEQFLKMKRNLFLERMAKGRVRDCHGDIHMEHVYLMDNEVLIIDCIEFNDRFRYSDVAADVAFLAMDLDFAGRHDLSALFIKEYERCADDPGIEPFVNFYKCYRAFVRGKVDSFELDDPNLDKAEKARIKEMASKYFKLAAEYARK